MIRSQIPVHPHRGPQHEGHSGPFSQAVVGGDDGPEADAGEGAEVTWTEILLPYQGHG